MERSISNSAEGPPRPGAVYVRRPKSSRKAKKEKREKKKGKKREKKRVTSPGSPPPQMVEDIRSEGTFRTRIRKAKPIPKDKDGHINLKSSYTWSSEEEPIPKSVPELFSKSKINLSLSSPIIRDGEIEVLGTLKQTLSPRTYNQTVRRFLVEKYKSSTALRDWYKTYNDESMPVLIVLSPRGQTYNRGHMVVYEPVGCTFNGDWCLVIRARNCVINGSNHFVSDCADSVIASTKTMVQGGKGNVKT